jgi:hypothetical protein
MALVKYNNNSISAVTSTGLATGSLVPIKTLTASSSATLSFVHGSDGVVLDSTYPIYKFEFINIHPASDTVNFKFQGSTNTGSSYGVTATTTFFAAYHDEADSQSALAYQTGLDIAQGTGFIDLGGDTGNDNDECLAGTLQLFNPSSTTFVKHFISRVNVSNHNPMSVDAYVGGYFNTTSVVDAIQFKFDSGNIDAGKIKLYGIKDS